MFGVLFLVPFLMSIKNHTHLCNGLAGCRTLWWLVLRTQTCDSKGLNLFESWRLTHIHIGWTPSFVWSTPHFTGFHPYFCWSSLSTLISCLPKSWTAPFFARQLSVDAATGWWLHHVTRSHCLRGVVWLTAPSIDRLGSGNWVLRGPDNARNLDASGAVPGACQFQGRETGWLLNSFGEKLQRLDSWSTGMAMVLGEQRPCIDIMRWKIGAAYTQHLTKDDIMRTVLLVFSTVVQSSWGDSFNLATSLI